MKALEADAVPAGATCDYSYNGSVSRSFFRQDSTASFPLRRTSPEDWSDTLGSRSVRSRGVSLVLPAYNEERRIVPTIEKYLSILESNKQQFEIIVVADGSDGTADIARKYGGRDVRVASVGHKLGKGGAILTGFRESRFDAIGYVDADGSLSSEDFRAMIQTIGQGEVDCVVASRWLPDSQWVHREPLKKMIASRGFNILTRGLLGLPISDTQCGAKFFRGNLVDRLLHRVTVTNVTWDVGFLYHARKLGARIKEMPVKWDDDPRSRFTVRTLVPIMLLTLLGIRLMNLPLRRFVPRMMLGRFQSLLGAI